MWQHAKENMVAKTAQSHFITRMIWCATWISTMGPSHILVIHVVKRFCAATIYDFMWLNTKELSHSSVICARGGFMTVPIYANTCEPIQARNRQCVPTVHIDALSSQIWENTWLFILKRKHFSVILVVFSPRIFMLKFHLLKTLWCCRQNFFFENWIGGTSTFTHRRTAFRLRILPKTFSWPYINETPSANSHRFIFISLYLAFS